MQAEPLSVSTCSMVMPWRSKNAIARRRNPAAVVPFSSLSTSA
jgi:hypothetical protein